MKKILFLFLCIFLSIEIVNATTIDSIDMDIVVDRYGTATITETWKVDINQGTEGYHPYYNLGSSNISVLSASMDGKIYTIESNWEENTSLSNKAYKAGIYQVNSNEVDIVFGISIYGYHTYKIVYQITNFVSNLTDSDMIYWQLFPYDFSSSPSNVTIKISGYYYYPDDLEVWGYGMYGALCYVSSGSIYMTSDGKISSNEYLTLLAKFPAGTFETTSKLTNDFSYYQDMAEDGSEAYIDSSSYSNNTWGRYEWFLFILPFAINIIIWIPISRLMICEFNQNTRKYKFERSGKKLPKSVNNFRDIPCNKNIYRAFWVANTYNLNKSKNDFLGVVLLKWIYDGNVMVETISEKKLLKEKKYDIIVFDHEPENVNNYEKDLYKYMLEASGDGKLEKDEFKKWCKKHYNKILGWTDKVLDYERDELLKEGKITDEVTKKGIIFKYDVHSYLVDESMKEEAIEMKGLKKFLLEFSEINKKEPIEVKLWHEYLMYAEIFGIARVVMERFKKLYPEVIEDMQNYNFNYETFIFLNSISTSGVSAASSARSAAQSYSSGGGGFSSGGGGGGSFGGGGGGGGFR